MKNASILLVLLLALVSTTSTVNGLRVKAMKGSGDKDKDKDKDKSTRSADKASSSGDKASRSSRDKSSSSTRSSRSGRSSSSSNSRSERYYDECDTCNKRKNKSFCSDLWSNTCRFGSDISHDEKEFCKDVGLIPNPCKDEEERFSTSAVNGISVKAMKGSGDKSKDKSTRSADKASRSEKASRSNKSSRDKSSRSSKSSRSGRSSKSSSSSSYSRSKRYYDECDTCNKRKNKSFCSDLWSNTCRFGSDISQKEKEFCKDVGLIPNPCKDEEERFFLDEGEETVSIE